MTDACPTEVGNNPSISGGAGADGEPMTVSVGRRERCSPGVPWELDHVRLIITLL